MDIKTHLANWDIYDIDEFNKARMSEPFQKLNDHGVNLMRILIMQ